MDLTINFIFYLVLTLLFTDLAFFIIKKFMAFANSLVHTTFKFNIVKLKKKKEGN